ncbi:activating signal cointegrator 1 isoform X1 [Colletes gigas]|uniref:activating signal cointegrator 1 isoform X1 n=2 Tax=Colletes gigas TaxID=935657 RepID=UPI001C9B1EE1|nr:activating signal cointegrator 1 isoform X1 [Colletes gigas]XP_043258371.1 activating signal cointegrator 1 isoform X1 [Colletes gigas]
MKQWIHENLSRLLTFPVPDNITEYIMGIQNERDLDEYLRFLLDCSNVKHKEFITELKKRQASNKDQGGYKKINDTDSIQRKQNNKKKGKIKGKEKQENRQLQEHPKVEKIEKKKTKFVNLYSQEGKDRTTILLTGRHKCDCEAKRHSLINNCLNCGRIVCMQEGAGPCFFCGELVCSSKDQTILSSKTKQADHLYNKLMNKKKPVEGLEESLKQRDKLLEYDRNSTQCTKVIDDECDYYQTSNIWLTTKQREKLQQLQEDISERKHTSRLNKRVNVTFDFTGREVIQEYPVDDFNEFNEEQIEDILESVSVSELERTNVCPDIEFSRPMYIESNECEPSTRKVTIPSKIRNIIQDKEYLEMSDAGLCLSMHQPYASLLVAGIKLHEGRTWYTSHRGRLWIASTAKPATTEEISEVKHFYRVLKDEKINFPDNYPSGCLLGCVTVTDVLSQEEYRKVYPNGESDSPYVFICENCYSLPIKFPIQGKHKIYKLDQKIHQAALKFLEKVTKHTNNYNEAVLNT